MNIPFIWGMRDMKWSWNLWHQDKPRRINIRWRRKQKKKELKKKKYKTAEGTETEEKEKKVKIKMIEKEIEKQGVQSKATHVQLHSFMKATTML